MQEFQAQAVSTLLDQGSPSELRLASAIEAELRQQYEQSASRFRGKLGAEGEFRLKARWKQKELRRKARKMSTSLNQTMNDRLAAIDADETLSAVEKRRAKREFVDYKKRQLDELVRADADFEAKTDMLAHSGNEQGAVIDVEKSEVMNFRNLGPNPCQYCVAIEGGNPYTVRRATTLGAKMHPNCKCEWEEEWEVDPALVDNTRRRVREGDVELWDGSSRTPVRGRASRKARLMRERKGGWTGRRIEQKKVATQRLGVSLE